MLNNTSTDGKPLTGGNLQSQNPTSVDGCGPARNLEEFALNGGMCARSYGYFEFKVLPPATKGFSLEFSWDRYVLNQQVCLRAGAVSAAFDGELALNLCVRRLSCLDLRTAAAAAASG